MDFVKGKTILSGAGLLLVFCSACISAATVDGRIERIGNPILSSASGVDLAGATFLINDIVLTDGVLYAYRAYFRSDMPVHMQIWRPEGVADSTGKKHFRLISDVRVIPSLVDSLEDIYLAAKLLDCAVVLENDRLGLYFEGSPGAVAYSFNSNDPNVFGHMFDPANASSVGDLIQFDTMIFPYDFSLSAYVDTDMTQYTIDNMSYTVDCPTSLMIPDVDVVDVITEAPITGAPGAVGATGAAGPSGNDGLPGVPGTDGTDGATGDIGPMGSEGATGPQGPGGVQGLVGATGSQGPPGPPGNYVGNSSAIVEGGASVATASTSMGTMTWVFMAWSILLTIILITVICFIVCVVRNKDDKSTAGDEELPARPNVDWKDKKNRPKSKRASFKNFFQPGFSVFGNNNDSDTGSDLQLREHGVDEPDKKRRGSAKDNAGVQPDDEENWMGTLKPRAETDYNNDTLNLKKGDGGPSYGTLDANATY